jgi:hypothetical protein
VEHTGDTIEKLFKLEIIPAHPGWRIVEPYPESGKPITVEHLHYETIIAWRIEIVEREDHYRGKDGTTHSRKYFFDRPPPAITSDGGSDHDAPILVRPDNSYTAPGYREWTNTDELLEHLNKERQEG